MNWNFLEQMEQLDAIDRESASVPVILLKHSTRCGISSAALSRLERYWKTGDHEKLKPYYLDLLGYRAISNEIERRYRVMHQSPQVLIIRNGKCVYSATHMEINYQDVMATVNA